MFDDGDLDDGEPFFGVLLIPDAVDVRSAGVANDLVMFLLQIGEEVEVALVEAVVGAVDIHAYSEGDFGEVLEFEDIGVGAFDSDLLTVFDIDILLFVAAVFKGEAIARFDTLAVETEHFGKDGLNTKFAQIVVRGDDSAVRSDNHSGDAGGENFFHSELFFLVVEQGLQTFVLGLEMSKLSLTGANLVFEGLDTGFMSIEVEEFGNFIKRETEVFQIADGIHFQQLLNRVVAVARPLVDFDGNKEPDAFVMTKGADRDLAESAELTDF